MDSGVIMAKTNAHKTDFVINERNMTNAFWNYMEKHKLTQMLVLPIAKSRFIKITSLEVKSFLASGGAFCVLWAIVTYLL